MSNTGFPEITNFEVFLERCNRHYFNYLQECRRQNGPMTEDRFRAFFRTLEEDGFNQIYLALRLRRFVDRDNNGRVNCLIPDFIDPTTNLDPESRAFAKWLLERFGTVENIR